MEIYKIKEGTIYNKNLSNQWVAFYESLEDAIKKFAGRETLMVIWRDDNDFLNCYIIESSKDKQ